MDETNFKERRNKEFIAERTENFDELVEVVSKYTPEKVAEICGINFDSNLQKLPNRYLYIDEAEGSRAVGVHSAGIIEGLRKLYGADALVAELTK